MSRSANKALSAAATAATTTAIPQLAFRPLQSLRPQLSDEPLSLEATLQCGQAFGWRLHQPSGAWRGTLGRWPLLLRQREPTLARLELCCLDPQADLSAVAAELAAYLQLSTPLSPLMTQWSASDARFRAVASAIRGLRILRQDPVECLFSFICSSNNNIPRITQMLDKLRRTFGEKVAEHEGEPVFAFPELPALARATEAQLREMGFGYRAKFIVNTTAKLMSLGGREYLEGLRRKSLDEVRTALTELDGVGPKVADCVALFSLDQRGAIPVDTHVWQISCRDMDASLKSVKSLTPAVYARVGQLFRERFGEYAGWAHSILFAAELPYFRGQLTADVVAAMDADRAAEKALKSAKRAAAKRSNDSTNDAEPTPQKGSAASRKPKDQLATSTEKRTSRRLLSVKR